MVPRCPRLLKLSELEVILKTAVSAGEELHGSCWSLGREELSRKGSPGAALAPLLGINTLGHPSIMLSSGLLTELDRFCMQQSIMVFKAPHWLSSGQNPGKSPPCTGIGHLTEREKQRHRGTSHPTLGGDLGYLCDFYQGLTSSSSAVIPHSLPHPWPVSILFS